MYKSASSPNDSPGKYVFIKTSSLSDADFLKQSKEPEATKNNVYPSSPYYITLWLALKTFKLRVNPVKTAIIIQTKRRQIQQIG